MNEEKTSYELALEAARALRTRNFCLSSGFEQTARLLNETYQRDYDELVKRGGDEWASRLIRAMLESLAIDDKNCGNHDRRAGCETNSGG